MKSSKLLLISGVLAGLFLLVRGITTKRPSRAYALDEIDDAELDDYRIREIAQQIWESEGKPEGQAARHWAMAIELLKSSLISDSYSNARHKNDRVQDPYSYNDKKSIH